MKKIDELKQVKWIIIFVIYLRYLIGGAILFSSIVKIRGGRFTSADGTTAPLNSALHLFETLFQSGIYWQFLGWSQFVAGGLLMTQFYAALGALVMFPIVLNIFIITISYDFSGTPVITSLLLLATLFLILWDYQKYLPLFHRAKDLQLYTLNNQKIESDWWWIGIGILLFSTTVAYVMIFDRTVLYWLLICFIFGLGGLLLYNKKNKRTK